MARTLTQNLDTLYTTTFQKRRKDIIDNIFTTTPLFYKLVKSGKARAEEGGRFIEEALEYAKNDTVKYFGKGDNFPIQDLEILTTSYWDWKYLGGSLTRYFTDEQKNRGKEAIIKMVTSKIDNLQRSLVDKMEVAMFSDGTGDGGKAIDGLGNIIAVAPTTGTVGTINRATYSWWRNNYKSMSGESMSVYLRKRMNTMFNDCGQQGEGISRFPDLIVTTQDVYEAYENELVEIKQVVNKEVGDLGFGDLTYKGRPITWSPSAPSGTMRFINTNFLEWVYDKYAQFDLTEWKAIPDQPNDRTAQAVVVGNLVCSNCKRQGVILAATTA
jgi:hypothetical protein